VTGEPDPEEALADLGAELATRVTAAVPAWVVRCVEARLPPGRADRARVLDEAEEFGRRAQEDVGAKLAALLSADVDAQRSTPLEVVRSAVSYPTAVLRGAGVAPARRDDFAEARFPDDPYGLTPASLKDVDPEVGDLALAWGAAKAMAHRRRHGVPEEFT
jgi:hypothetical protein